MQFRGRLFSDISVTSYAKGCPIHIPIQDECCATEDSDNLAEISSTCTRGMRRVEARKLEHHYPHALKVNHREIQHQSS